MSFINEAYQIYFGKLKTPNQLKKKVERDGFLGLFHFTNWATLVFLPFLQIQKIRDTNLILKSCLVITASAPYIYLVFSIAN